MTTSTTRTRALCVATRCTSVDQFVATFHRFCGDDESFFVATMTSRPVGLETAFSIQLADKQPVLRGLCIVLDAWETSENRYKRPGIRLGIKRLTAESQRVFDRLRAAARAPAVIAEATPPPGPPPAPGPPGAPRPATLPGRALAPPRLPPILPRSGLPSLRTPTVAATPPPLPRLPPIVAGSTATPIGAPPISVTPTPHVAAAIGAPPISVTPASRAATAVVAPPLAVAPATAVGAPPLAVAPASHAATAPARAASGHGYAAPAPVAITRFQIALHVGTVPPPVDGVEFKPTLLPVRQRAEPRIISEPGPDDAAIEPASPAMIIDRPGVVEAGTTQDTAPTVLPDAGQLRTPGSALVLPANPLHDLSDESLEGFVDCTLYEEATACFPADSDGRDWNGLAAPVPVAPPASPPPTSVPAMPFDTPPDVTLRAVGDTESLTVTADDPAPEPPRVAASDAFATAATDSLFAPLHAQRAPSVAPWLAARARSAAPWLEPPAPPDDAPPTGAIGAPPAFEPAGVGAGGPGAEPGSSEPQPQSYGVADPVQYRTFSATHVIALPDGQLQRPRWALIASSAIVAIVLAFVVARLVRGGATAAPVTIRSPGGATPRPAASVPSPHLPSPPPGAQLGKPGAPPAAAPVSSAGTRAGSAALAAVVPHAGDPAGAQASGNPLATDPGQPGSPDEDGEALAGGTPVAGSGPCRVTIATTPAGSIVRLDDQPMGASPLTIEGSCDRHKLDISHVRYQGVTRWVTLVADTPQSLDINLPRPIHAVTVMSVPPGAALSIDGHRAGTTPTVIQMMGFATVNLTFTMRGFQTVTRRVYSKLAQDRVLVKLGK
jgi:PEGA domain